MVNLFSIILFICDSFLICELCFAFLACLPPAWEQTCCFCASAVSVPVIFFCRSPSTFACRKELFIRAGHVCCEGMCRRGNVHRSGTQSVLSVSGRTHGGHLQTAWVSVTLFHWNPFSYSLGGPRLLWVTVASHNGRIGYKPYEAGLLRVRTQLKTFAFHLNVLLFRSWACWVFFALSALQRRRKRRGRDRGKGRRV